MSYLNYVPIKPTKKYKKSKKIQSELEKESIQLPIEKYYEKYDEDITQISKVETIQENITDLSKKHMDFDSTYRNRNQYPNPCDYNIPVYSSNNTYFTNYYQNFIDLIDDSTPISNSLKSSELNVTGYSSDSLHIQLDLLESDIPNFYINTTIEIDGDYRNVIYYDNVNKIVTIDEPFVAIPQPGRPYTFRKYKNTNTANITPIELTYIPGQITPVVNKVYGDVSVSQLSILSSNVKITKDLFANSVIRFLNGPHKEKTSSVISFDQIVPDEGWIQPYYGSTDIDNQSSMELLSYYNSKGLSFTYSGINYFYLYSITIRVFSSSSSRLLLLELYTGDLNVPETIEYYRTTSLISLTPYTEQNITINFDTPILLRPQRTIDSITYNTDTVNIYIQDITDGGNANNFLNVITSNTSQVNIELFGFNTVPYLIFNGYIQETTYQSNSYGNNIFVNTNTKQGIRIYNKYLSLPLYLILDTDVFDDTTNRTIQIEIREGENLNNPIIYTNNITVNNTSYIPISNLIFNNYNLSNDLNYDTYWLYSLGSTNLINLPNEYNNLHEPCSYVVPSDIDTNSYIIIELTGNTINGLLPNDLTLYINNSGSIESLYKNTITYNITPGSFNIYFKIDNALDVIFIPEQNLDFIFSISKNVNTLTNPITNFTMNLNYYNSISNKIELYKLDNPLNIYSNNITFINNSINSTSWLYSGSFNYLPNGYNNLGFPSSYTTPNDFQTLVSIKLTFNGFTDGILNPNDFVLKINNHGTSNTLKSFYNPSVDNINFSINFYITPNDNISFTSNQQLDFILCIYITNNTFYYTQLNVDFRYIDNNYYTGSLSYLKPNSYYTLTFLDTTGDNNNNGFINLNGYISAPENNNQTSLITTNFNGVCPSLRINAIDIINNEETTIWNNFNETDFIQKQPVSTYYEHYVLFISTFTGNIQNITLNLMCYQSVSTFPRNRQLQINFYNDNLILLGSTTVNIPCTYLTNNNSYHYDTNINLSTFIPVTNGNYYLFSVLDVTGDNNTNGFIYLYGSNVNYDFNFNLDIFPRFFLNRNITPSITINNSLLNPFDKIPISSEVGFEFVFNQNIGVINPFLIALSSFSSLNITNPDYVYIPNTSQRTLRIRYRFGSGLSGSILYERNYIVNALLEPYITSVFLSDLSLDLLAGQKYTLTLQDVTPSGNTLGYTWFHGINSIVPYNSFNTGIYPLLYLSQVFYYVTISPPMPLTGFLNNGFDLISFNSLIRENYRPLNYRGLPYTDIKYYEVRLKHLIMPNKLLKVCNGGYLINYPFFYIELFNEGDRTTTSLMFSNNNNQNVIFKVYIDKTYYDQPTSFYVLKTYEESEQRQIFGYRPDKDTRIRILMPDGQTTVQYYESDNLSPFYPNPLLQTNILLSLRPVNNFNPFIKNNFIELE
jgi:hypothetical protein